MKIENTNRFMLLIVAVGTMVFAAMLIFSNPCSGFVDEVDNQFSGIVIRKFVKRNPKMETDTGSIFIAHFVGNDLYEEAEEGDSIFKIAGVNRCILSKNGWGKDQGKEFQYLSGRQSVECK